MSSLDNYFLFDTKTKQQFGPFDEQDFIKVLLTLEADELESHQIWRSDWQNWQPANDWKSHVKIKIDVMTQPGSSDSKIISLHPTYKETRLHPRLDLRFKCTIRNNDTSVETYTKDISLGGIQLESAIPQDMLKQKCQVLIHDPNSYDSIEFDIHLTQRQEPLYFYFSNFSEGDLQKLQLWMSRLSQPKSFKPKLKV